MDERLEKALRISAALARQRYAGEDKRIDKGLVIALNDKVSVRDGLCRVQSDRDAEVFYVISAHGCDCPDSTGAAPDHRCKHVWAGKLLAHAFQNTPESSNNFDSQSKVLENPDDKCSVSDDAQENDQKESSMSDVVLYTTAPKSFDKDTTVEVCDKFLYRDNAMRKVSIPSKKVLTQKRTYDKPALYFTYSEERANELRENGSIIMQKETETAPPVAEPTPEPEPEAPAPKRKRAPRKVTTTSTREDGTVVHVTAPENEPVEPNDTRPIQGCATQLETLVEEVSGKPYAGPASGTFTVVECVKGTAPAGLPESPLAAHLSCNKGLEPAPKVTPEITPVMQLRGIAQHMLSYDVYENMLEALVSGLKTMGMKLTKLGESAPVHVQTRPASAPQEPKAPSAPRVQGEGVKAKRFDDAWAEAVCARYATGTIKKGELATELGIPASTLYHYLRRGNVLHLGKK